MSLKLKAKSYKCRFLEAGVSNNGGVAVLIRAENLMQLAEKFKGVPFSISHEDLNPENVDDYRVGITANVFKGDDGWAWSEFLIDKEEGETLLNQGYNISCAYTVLNKGLGGIHNGVEYDFEVLDLQADHIAIVDVPHYTDAIVVKNSNNIKPKIKNMFKFLKSKNKAEAIENSMEEKEEAFVKNGEGKVSVADLIENYRKMKNEESESAKKEEEEIIDESDEIEVDGDIVSVGELLNSYKNSCKNESEDKEEKEKHLDGAEKDDKDHIEDLEKDEKDDKESKEEIENSEDKKDEDKKESVKNEATKTESDFDVIKNAKKEFLEGTEEGESLPNYFEESQKKIAAIQAIYGASNVK